MTNSQNYKLDKVPKTSNTKGQWCIICYCGLALTKDFPFHSYFVRDCCKNAPEELKKQLEILSKMDQFNV